MMNCDSEVSLITQAFNADSIGNQVPAETKFTVFCTVRSIKRSEFYSAAVAGLRPELVFVVRSFEYAGQQIVEYDHMRYRVIRAYTVSIEDIELICQRVGADG